jgi:hypothetical protein
MKGSDERRNNKTIDAQTLHARRSHSAATQEGTTQIKLIVGCSKKWALPCIAAVVLEEDEKPSIWMAVVVLNKGGRRE